MTVAWQPSPTMCSSALVLLLVLVHLLILRRWTLCPQGEYCTLLSFSIAKGR